MNIMCVVGEQANFLAIFEGTSKKVFEDNKKIFWTCGYKNFNQFFSRGKISYEKFQMLVILFMIRKFLHKNNFFSQKIKFVFPEPC